MSDLPVILGLAGPQQERTLSEEVAGLVSKLGGARPESQSEKGFGEEAKGRYEWIPYPYGLSPSWLVELFWLDPTHHSCVVLKAKSLMVDDYSLVRLDNDPGEPPGSLVRYIRQVFPAGLGEVIYPAAIDYEAVGNAYIEVIRKADARTGTLEGQVARLVHVPAFSVFRLPPDHPTGCSYVQLNGSHRVYFREYGQPGPTSLPDVGQKRVTEILHVKNHGGASASNYWYGLPDILAAINAIRGAAGAMEYLTTFFQARGAPNYFLFLRGAAEAKDAVEISTINRYFNEALQRGAGRVVVMPLASGVEESLQPISLRADPEDVVEFISECRDQIARVHGVPLRLLSVAQAASLGSAAEAATQIDYFREFIVRPRQVLWETVLYQVLLAQRWPDWKIAFRQLTTEDALKMAQADALSVRTGIISPNEARARRALGPVPGGDEVVFLSAGGQPLPVRTLGEWRTLPGGPGTEQDALEEAAEEKARRSEIEVQSVLCPKTEFASAAEAAEWCRKHGFKADKVDETEEFWRFRQFDPSLCVEDSFRTIRLGGKAKAIVCQLRMPEKGSEAG